MELEIDHPPIQCGSCQHMNTENAISVIQTCASINDFASSITRGPDLKRPGVNLIFSCQKCPQITFFEKKEIEGSTVWELP